MTEYINILISKISLLDFNILLLLGLCVFGGTVGGRIFQKLKIPKVVGYIAIGIVVGKAGFNIINDQIIQALQPLNYFALGLIGFVIGGELKKEIIKKQGKQFAIILFSEASFAFLSVFLLVGTIGTFLYGNSQNFWMLGLVLGAMASATAPAATTDVLWEHKTKGSLTNTIFGIVAMDDALSLIFFGIATSIAIVIIKHTSEGILSIILHPVYEIGGAILISILLGKLLVKFLKKYTEEERILSFSLGSVLLVLGMSLALKVDMLLSAMTLGVVVVNSIPRISKKVFDLVSGFAHPIYILFFVLVGAKVDLKHLTFSVVILSVVYLIARTMGKMFGAYFGSSIAQAPQRVKKYLPFCLFSQAGVAIGLSIIAYHLFPGAMGNSIVIIITLSTFVVQVIGPSFVKYAITKAGEVNLNVSEDDLLKMMKVADVMITDVSTIKRNANLSDIFKMFSEGDQYHYPVVDANNKLLGIITVDSIRQTFTHSEFNNLLIAEDIMQETAMTINTEISMVEVKDILDRYNLSYLPVVKNDNTLVGYIERRALSKFISTKLIENEQKAYASLSN